MGGKKIDSKPQAKPRKRRGIRGGPPPSRDREGSGGGSLVPAEVGDSRRRAPDSVQTFDVLDIKASRLIFSGFIREGLMDDETVKDAYAAGGRGADDMNSSLAKDRCADV